MRFGKPWWLSAIVLAAVLSGVQLHAQLGVAAQPPSNGTPRRTSEAVSELRMLTQQLNLTPEQREKLRPIVTEQGERLHDLRIDEHFPPDVKRAKMAEVREQFGTDQPAPPAQPK
jgi:Spy/CpxP family protein refolding chaperone